MKGKMMENEFMIMREIGKLFGTTSHAIGRKLKELRLRDDDGTPTWKAINGGYCKKYWTEDMAHYSWTWHAEKTVRLLQLHFDVDGLSELRSRQPLASGAKQPDLVGLRLAERAASCVPAKEGSSE
jgi:hypothetical protein